MHPHYHICVSESWDLKMGIIQRERENENEPLHTWKVTLTNELNSGWGVCLCVCFCDDHTDSLSLMENGREREVERELNKT